MRHTSKARAALDRKWRQPRRDYLEEFPHCMACPAPSVCVHEIACGMSIRALAKYEPATWLASCAECNKYRFTDYSTYPLERQLGLKWIFDFERFDLERVCEIRGRAPTAITIADVRPYIISELTGSRFSGDLL